MTKKATKPYHPGRSHDNAKAIASGELQVLVDYLRELAQIPWVHRDLKTRDELLLERAMAALEYAEALAAHLVEKGRGAPRELFTPSDVVRAADAASEYKRLKGTRPAARLEKEILNRYGISRAVLRAALQGKLPQGEFPGIPSAEK